MWKKNQSLSPLPEDHLIYEHLLKVDVIQYRKEAAYTFARSSYHDIELEQEPDNKHDPNAIKVIGISGWWIFKSRDFIGYLPKEVSKQIVDSKLWGSIRPRLLRIFSIRKGKRYIEFQIVGPKDKKQQYDQFRMNKPAAQKQREFLKYFSVKMPKGNTIEQAEELIKDSRKKM